MEYIRAGHTLWINKDLLIKMCYAMTHISSEYSIRLLKGCHTKGLHSIDNVLVTVQYTTYTASLCTNIS
jgi:hypothetical protein